MEKKKNTCGFRQGAAQKQIAGKEHGVSNAADSLRQRTIALPAGVSPHTKRVFCSKARHFSPSGRASRTARQKIWICLGVGANDIPTLENIFREICEIDGGGDGLEFAKDSIKGAEIRADKTYQGIRLDDARGS